MQDFTRSRRASFGSFIVDGRGTILGLDHAMEALTQWPAMEVVGRHKDLGLTARPDRPGVAPIRTVPFYEGILPVAPHSGNVELTLNCRDGRKLEVEALLRALNGSAERTLVTVLRVLASSAEAALSSVAPQRDALTDLLDRDAFASRLAAELRRATEQARPLSLILLDVDHLRETNDRLGREAGDRVLRRLAGILRVSVEDEERIARLEDDDFAVLLTGSGRGEARQVAAALRSTVERFRFFPDNSEVPAGRVTISLGAASFPADADTEEELVERARDALDEARSMGRNRVWCYLRRPRVPVQVPVYFDGADSLLMGYSRDLSPSGIFVQTSAGIDVGMRCALAFPLPGLDGRVHVVGRVVRTVFPEVAEDNHDVRIPGLGLEFERFGGSSDRRAIDAFLHDREALSERPETGRLSIP
jgi:diguanylate cyclase (GGDEF)-like protein